MFERNKRFYNYVYLWLYDSLQFFLFAFWTFEILHKNKHVL